MYPLRTYFICMTAKKFDKVHWLHPRLPVFLRNDFSRMTKFSNSRGSIIRLSTYKYILVFSWLRESYNDYWLHQSTFFAKSNHYEFFSYSINPFLNDVWWFLKLSEKYTHKWSIKLRQFLSQMRKTNSTKLIDCIIKFLYFWEVIWHAWLNFSTCGNEWIIWPSGYG